MDWPTTRRQQVLLGAIALGLVLLTAGLVWWLARPRATPTAEQPALQAGEGTVQGTVRTVAGAPLGGVTVSTTALRVTTTATGTYSLGPLAPGTVVVTTTATGYVQQSQSVALGAAQTLTLDFALVPGGFTKAEAGSVQNLVWAGSGGQAGQAGSLHDGTAAVVDLILQRQTTATTRTAIKNLKHAVRRAQLEINGAVFDLMGAMPKDATQPRAYYVDRAKGRVNNLKTNLLPAVASAADACKAAGAAGVYPWTIDRFKTINLAGAIDKVSAFDTGLGYADPYPTGRRGERVTIIGPHGKYVSAMRWQATALDRMDRLYVAAIDGYGADALLPSYEPTYQRLKFINLLLQKIMLTSGIYNGLTFAGFSQDPFFRTLSALEFLTHGGGGPVTVENDCKNVTTGQDTCHAASYDFNNVKIAAMNDWAQMSGRPNFSNALRTQLAEITEAWQATDTAVWFGLDFPECEKTGGCGGQ